MSCPQCEKISAYHDKALATEEMVAFEAHLAACEACARELARLQKMSNFLVAAAFQRARPHVDWRAGVQRSQLLRLAQVLTGVAAAIMLICGGALLRTTDEPRTSSVRAWERVAATRQFEPPAAEVDDPLVQALFQDE